MNENLNPNMVIESASFPAIARKYNGFYADAYIVGINEFYREGRGSGSGWQEFTEPEPKTIRQFCGLMQRMSDDSITVVSLTFITPAGVKQRDFNVAELTTPAGDIAPPKLEKDLCEFIAIAAQYREAEKELRITREAGTATPGRAATMLRQIETVSAIGEKLDAALLTILPRK